jgi:hypothetical protein
MVRRCGSVRYYAFSSLKDTIYTYTVYYITFRNKKRNTVTSFFYLYTLKSVIFKGWFRVASALTLSSEGRATPEEVTGSAVKKAGVIFIPTSKLQKMLKAAKFTK